MYPPEAPYVVYCPECWWSDQWSPLDYGQDYDFSRPFFAQFKELWQKVPLLGLSIHANCRATSPYTNHVIGLKNCYLIFQAGNNENASYGFYMMFSKEILDSSLVYSSERMYDSSNCYKCSNGIGMRDQVTESIDSYFLSNCHNCKDCFASRNLRNKKYVAFNEQYTREEYERIVSQYDLGSWKVYQEVKQKAEEHWKKFSPDPDVSERVVNSTGSHIFECKNCQECYEVVGATDCKYMLLIGTGPVTDCYDVTSWGDNLSRAYEVMNSGINVSDVRFTFDTGIGVRDGEYITGGVGSVAHVFGSVALKRGEYVILNKQYSKEEYEALREKIIAHMNAMPYIDKNGESLKYGEFFSSDLSIFPCNLTMANLFFPLSKEEALEKGYAWRDLRSQEYVSTMEANELPDHIKDVLDSITKEVISCEKCSRRFRILEDELAMRRRMNVPLPRTCPFCRIEDKMRAWVKSLTLHGRVCAQCNARFQSNFDENDAPYILCKPCYMKEVV